MYISLVATVSRKENLQLVCENIGRILLPEHWYELVVAIDNRDINTFETRKVFELLAGGYGFRNLVVFNTKNPPPPKLNVDKRRTRIAALREATKEHIGGSQFVFSFEDDSVLPENALEQIIVDWALNNEKFNIGMISGVQAGRWGRPYIGAWNVDNPADPKEYQSVKFRKTKKALLEEVDAAGFYCYLTLTELYKKIDYKWYDPLGPDVFYCLALRSAGYQIFIDWSVLVGHKTKDETLMPGKDSEQAFFKLVDNRWHSSVKGVS